MHQTLIYLAEHVLQNVLHTCTISGSLARTGGSLTLYNAASLIISEIAKELVSLHGELGLNH